MISPMTVYQRYRRYLEVAGISHGSKGQGPRLHDIRYPNLYKIQTFSQECPDYRRCGHLLFPFWKWRAYKKLFLQKTSLLSLRQDYLMTRQNAGRSCYAFRCSGSGEKIYNTLRRRSWKPCRISSGMKNPSFPAGTGQSGFFFYLLD